MRALVGTYVRALTCSHMSVYGLCMCGRACVCASGHVRVFMRAWVRECMCACMLACAYIRMYDYCIVLLLWSAVAQWVNAGLAIEREVFESPLIPFRSLGIFFLFTMPQFTQLYKLVLVYRQWWTCE